MCNNSVLGKQEIGDATELALLHMGKELGYDKEQLARQYPRVMEIPFESEKKYMATVHKDSGHETVYVKGACDYILERCTYVQKKDHTEPMTQAAKMKIRMAMETMARDGLRVLALGYRERVTGHSEEELTNHLVFAGMAGMIDPPKKKVAQSVKTLKKAGVQVVMITGDYKDTAFAVARKIGIADFIEQCMTGRELEEISDAAFARRMKNIRVFARVTPALSLIHI